MASRFQQQSLRRKVIYSLLIVVLFTVTLLLRRADAYGVEAQANRLELREQNLGEVELTDKALRLTLTGSRGFAVCGLWWAAIEKQKKHEWNELELLVRSLIKLQPHFATPWLFQSWNLSYNVSAECDRIKDKYFYIGRGIQLLADGERLNRNNPDMRLYVGFYTQNKMGMSDQNNTLRSLFQMSCIDPVERDPARFRRMVNERPTIDMEAFEDFCRRHPFLVRRLHDRLRCRTPEDIVDFLAANQKIPSRFEEKAEANSDTEQTSSQLKKVAEERFPILPPAQKFSPGEVTNDALLGDDFDNYAAARAWYGYAQDPLDMGVARVKSMSQIIVQSYPPRAQEYYADRLEQEGWFDTEGWDIRDWFPKDRAQPNGPKRVLTVGTDRNWAREGWEKTYQMYKDFGESKGLLKTEEQLKEMSSKERRDYDYHRDITNFAHHLGKAEVERLPAAVMARKCFYKADQLRQVGDRELAMEMYERPEAFPVWKKLLLENPLFRDDDDIQEETYLMQRKYLALVRDKRLKLLQNLLAVQDCLTWAAIPAPAMPWGVPVHAVSNIPLTVRGPFTDTDKNGRPLLSQRTINAVVTRYHLAPEVGQAVLRPPSMPKNTPPVRQPPGFLRPEPGT